MSDYTLKFMLKGDRGYWSTIIYADTKEQAIEKAEKILDDENYKRAKLIKIVYGERKVKEWKNE